MFRLADESVFTDISHNKGVTVATVEGKIPLSRKGQAGALAIHAPSVRAYIDHVEEAYPIPKRSRESSSYEVGFNELRSYEETLDIFKNKAETLRVFSEKDDMLKTPSSIGNDIFYDLAGDFLDMGKVMEGHPEVFGNMFMGNPRGLYADVVMNLSQTCHFPTDAIMERMNRVVRLVDWLESQQIRTKISGFLTNEVAHVEIEVKDYHELVDLDSLSVVLHTDFFRRMIFRAMEWSPTFVSTYGKSTLISNGNMNPPVSSEARKLHIYTEGDSSKAYTTAKFNQAEKQIEEYLEQDTLNITVVT